MSQLIEFTSYDPSAVEHYPPVPAHKVVPEWYKDIQLSIDWGEDQTVPTIKRCVPVRDYLTSGYVITNPYEVTIRYEEDDQGILKASNMCPAEDFISAHPHPQCPVHMNNVRNHYFKISNVWRVTTPPGYSCHFYQPFYDLNEDYKLFPAIVDTDKHDDAVNFVGVGLKRNFTIPVGAPLMIVYPFKRDDWKMKVGFKDFTNKNAYRFWTKKTWHSTYARLFHSSKKFR